MPTMELIENIKILKAENAKLKAAIIGIVPMLNDLVFEGNLCDEDIKACDAVFESNIILQYFYKVDECKTQFAQDENCICWHDESTGPRADRSYHSYSKLTWRIK